MFIVFSLIFSSKIIYAEESLGLDIFKNGDLPKEKQVELKEEMKKNRLEKRREMKKEIKNTRQEFQEKLAIKREENREILIKNKEDLKLRLQTIKDENKQSTVLNINENITKINERATDRLSNLISTIEEILEKIENKINIAKEQNLDTSPLELSIDEAKTKITETKNLIEIQAGKIYKIEVTNELNLRDEIKDIRNTFNDDLKNLQNKVRETHSFTRISAQKLGELLNTQEDKKTENQDDSEENQ